MFDRRKNNTSNAVSYHYTIIFVTSPVRVYFAATLVSKNHFNATLMYIIENSFSILQMYKNVGVNGQLV